MTNNHMSCMKVNQIINSTKVRKYLSEFKKVIQSDVKP